MTMSDDAQRALPVEERVEPAAGVTPADRQHRVERHEQGHAGQHPVEDARVVAARRARRGAGRSGAVADEDQRQHRGQEEDQVVLVAPLQRGEHLPQHEHRGQEAQRDDDAVEPRGEPAAGRSSSYSAISSSADRGVDGGPAGVAEAGPVGCPSPLCSARICRRVTAA